MGHDHSHAVTGISAGSKHARRLAWALGMTTTYMAAEIIGGLWTGSLALLADAAHMFTDAAGLALALLAIRFAARPATPQKTFGYLRAEILAALLNASALLLVSGFILYEAYQRLLNPPEIIGGPMLVVASVGLVVNLISMRILSAGSAESLNVRGAYIDVLSDMLGSLGVIVAAAIVMWTGWRLIDPIIGAGIGLFIIPRTLKLLNEATHILLEGVPADVDFTAVQLALQSIPGVRAVHDLHIWTITSGVNALSTHLEIGEKTVSDAVLRHARTLMKERFHIGHITIQIEEQSLCGEEAGNTI